MSIPAIEVRADARGLILALEEFGDRARAQAQANALNRTGTTVRAQSAREIAAYYSLKVNVVRNNLKMARANRGHLVVTITSRGEPIPLIDFSARPVARGVTAKVRRERVLYPGAFIATMPNGHVGVFMRKPGVYGRKFRNQAYPWHVAHPQNLERIRQLVGPSLPQAFAQERVQAALRRVAVERYSTVLRQELNRLQLRNTGAR